MKIIQKKEALAKAIEQKGFINSYLAKSKGKDKISVNEVTDNIEVKIVNKFTLTHCANIENNVTKINNEDGIHLFSVERKNIKECELSVKEFYNLKGIHWFETSADNYHKMLFVNPDLKNREKCKEFGLLYFTWKEVVEFADLLYFKPNTDIGFMLDSAKYLSGSKGDWKKVKNGADDFLLVSMEGIPYWADAVGQIPFAINIYKGFLQLTQDKVKVKNATINVGYAFSKGKIEQIWTFFNDFVDNFCFKDYIYDEMPNPPADKNSYDNKMILRAIGYTYLSKYSNTESLALDSTRKAIYE